MKNYCTVLLKLAEKFSLAASQPKALASLLADHFLVCLMVAEFYYHSLKKPLAFTNCVNNMFNNISDTHHYQTRGSLQDNYFRIPINKQITKTAISYSGPKLWTDIPGSIGSELSFS